MKVAHPLSPLLSLTFSLLFSLEGLLLSSDPLFPYFVLALLLLLICFSYGKIAAKLLLLSSPFLLVSFLLSFWNAPLDKSLLVVARFAFLFLCSSLSLSVDPLSLVRNLQAHHFPRWLSLAVLLPLRFLFLFKEEIRRIHWARKSRNLPFSPRLLYRAYLFPLLGRLFSLTDLLHHSLQSRAFSLEREASVYQPPLWCRRDSLFACLATFLCLLPLLLLTLEATTAFTLQTFQFEQLIQNLVS